MEPNTADLLQSCLVVNPFNRPPERTSEVRGRCFFAAARRPRALTPRVCQAMKILNHGAFQGGVHVAYSIDLCLEPAVLIRAGSGIDVPPATTLRQLVLPVPGEGDFASCVSREYK